MKIAQFKYSRDNLGYLVYNGHGAIAIDGGAPKVMTEFARERGIRINWVTNTHSHADHTPGNTQLLEMTGAQFADCRSLRAGQVLDLGVGEGIEVIPSPGHTLDSVCFKGDGFLVTGDTVFNGTVGNCFSGDLQAFFRSLKRLLTYPGHTKIYAGHDYVIESLTYAAIIEPGNPDFDRYRASYDPALVVSTLADELAVNPYLRFNAPAMIRRLEEEDAPRKTEFHRFSSIMELY